MMRFILVWLIALSIGSNMLAQKVTEERLIDYEWTCLNRGITDENLRNFDTLILLQYSDWDESYSDEEELEPIDTFDRSNCFNFHFEYEPHQLSVSQVDFKSAAIGSPQIIDSLLYEQLEKDSLLQLEASVDFLSSLQFGFEGRRIVVVNSKNRASFFYLQMTANNWTRYYSKHPVFVTAIESFFHASWEFDRKKKELTIVSATHDHQLFRYKVERIDPYQIRLVLIH